MRHSQQAFLRGRLVAGDGEEIDKAASGDGLQRFITADTNGA